MECYGIMPKRKRWVKIAVILFGLYLIYSSIANQSYFYLTFGVIMILATFSDRKHVISEEGVDILYTLCGIPFHNLWGWEEINTIHTDSLKSKPYVELHIGKDVVSRRFILSKEDACEVVRMAKKMNAKIYIATLNSQS